MKKKKDKIKKDENLDNTIFIRNVSFETTEEDFKKFFEQFGKVYFAKVKNYKKINNLNNY